MGILFLGGTILWACGPFIPDWLLGDDESVLAAPTTRFKAEAERLSLMRSEGREPFDETPPVQQTLDADLNDLRSILDEMHAAPDLRRDLLTKLQQLREALQASAVSSEGWKAAGSPAPQDSPVTAVQVPAGLPPEFEAYLRGAVAYHQGRLDEARRPWEALLARPAGERRYRSTWAAFMLGKSYLESDPQNAVKWFERTREIAAEKDMRDSLGLAAASLGWEAKVELERGRFARAIHLYAEQARAGDPGALQSLHVSCAKALESSQEALLEVARDAQARGFVTALVLSRTRSFHIEPEGAQTEARKWLTAIEKAGIKIPASEADRLAWISYRAADFDAAGRWLGRQERETPMGKWIRARLLLRSGDISEARELLAEAAQGLVVTPPIEPDEAFTLMFEGGDPVATPWRAGGEAGAAALAVKDYPASLQALLAGGYWQDAAYVAERVLTVDELKGYVDEHWPVGLVSPPDPEAWSPNVPGLFPKPKGEIAYDLRYLLARRLIRAGRYDEARSYLPAELQADLEDLAGARREAKDGQRSAEQRAAALFRAACVTRWKGLELLGTEVDPDWFALDGQFDLGSTLDDRIDREKDSRLGPSPEEIERARKHEVPPAARFHYRYVAADLGWQAAALLPDGSPEKARLLAASGTWLKNRDPKAAQRFFEELVRCCGETELGREAREKSWFPAVEGCGPVED